MADALANLINSRPEFGLKRELLIQVWPKECLKKHVGPALAALQRGGDPHDKAEEVCSALLAEDTKHLANECL